MEKWTTNKTAALERLEGRTQGRLLVLAAVFMAGYAGALTVSSGLSLTGWGVDNPWLHWIGIGVWVVGFGLAAVLTRSGQPGDKYLLPFIALLSGWGLMTIWRLSPRFGLRQTIWLGLALIIYTVGVRTPAILRLLRRYKYLWLTGGLGLTVLTFLLGTNPLGYGPRLWLGLGGVYIQPSEPLKLLLIVYLAAYLADRQHLLSAEHNFPVPKRELWMAALAPTLVMTGVALGLLIFQRDLGTASIFIFIYIVMVFQATRSLWIPLAGLVGLTAFGIIGYRLFDVIRLRVDAWLNPWIDPSGRSYQIVQSLISIANGGLLGRGPGIGYPNIVPVAHSDFVFAAIAEEMGLIGVFGLFALLGLLIWRGMRIAIYAQNRFHRYLAAGLTAHLAAQSVLIIGGNVRLLPLTGVTLPFTSYGGSSLLVSFISLTLLMLVSRSEKRPQVGMAITRNWLMISGFLLAGISAAGLVTGWWSFYRGPDLLTRTDNGRRSLSEYLIPRGALLDRDDQPIVTTTGEPENYQRITGYTLGPVIGYDHPVYGQSGLESSLDAYLRGISGNPPLEVWLHHLLYGNPPPGVDVRLTMDLDFQRALDQALEGQTGAGIIVNAESGEILAITSVPGYDPDSLDEEWESLLANPDSPLLNRAAQGIYPADDLLATLHLPNESILPAEITPTLQMELHLPEPGSENANPLQMTQVAAAITRNGVAPSLRIAQAIGSDGSWTTLSSLGENRSLYTPNAVDIARTELALRDDPFWLTVHIPAEQQVTWVLAGTLPEYERAPLALVLVMENYDDRSAAAEIAIDVLRGVTQP